MIRGFEPKFPGKKDARTKGTCMYYIFNKLCKSVMFPTLRTAFCCRAKDANQDGEVMRRCSLVLDLEDERVARTVIDIEDAIIANFVDQIDEIDGNVKGSKSGKAGKTGKEPKIKYSRLYIRENMRRGILPPSDDFPSLYPRLRLTMSLRTSGALQYLDSKDCIFYGPDRKRITNVIDIPQDEGVNVCARPAWILAK